MSEFKHLDDIERREHRDLILQWLVGAALMVLMLATVVGFCVGP